jgi:uncharacterized membrane protein YfcA
MTTIVTLVIGAIIGLSSGLFGIGGALLSTPILKIWLNLPPLIALATPLPAAIPAAISGSIAFARNGLIRFDVAWRVLLVALPMTVVGAYLTTVVPASLLMIATGLVLCYSAGTFIRRGFRKGRSSEVESPTSAETGGRLGGLALASGALAGFTSGFLAIGGGIILIPVLLKVVGLTMKQTIATSLFCVAVLAIPGVIVHHFAGHIDWHVALLLSASVIPFSYLGARLTTRLRAVTVERVYGIVMMIFAIYFIIKNIP